MANIRDLKEPNGNVFYPLTHERAVKDSNGVSLETKLAGLESKSYIEAWDGASTPVVANIPAGVTVTYNSTTYTGTLAASASTEGKIYLVKNGDNYDRYITSLSGSTYSWVSVGSTQMELSGYATDAELSQLQQEEIDLSKYVKVMALPNNLGKWVSLNQSYPYMAYFIPVSGGESISIKGDPSKTFLYCFLTAPNYVNGTDVDYATGYSGNGRNTALGGETVVAPADAEYLYILVSEDGGTTYIGPTEIAKSSTVKDIASKEADELITSRIDGERINYTADKLLYSDGVSYTAAGWSYTDDYIPVKQGDMVLWAPGLTNANACLVIYNTEKEVLGYFTANAVSRTIQVPQETAAYIRASFATSNIDNNPIVVNSKIAWEPIKQDTIGISDEIAHIGEAVQEINATVDDIKDAFTQNIVADGGIERILPTIYNGNVGNPGNAYQIRTGLIKVVPGSTVKVRPNVVLQQGYTYGFGYRTYKSDESAWRSVAASADGVGNQVYTTTSVENFIIFEIAAYDAENNPIALRAPEYQGILDIIISSPAVIDSEKYKYLIGQLSFSPGMVASRQSNPLVLLHFSDIHGSGENYNRIMSFRRDMKDLIHDVISTGDNVYTSFADSFDFWNDRTVLNAIGNHDTAKLEGSSYDWTYYAGKQAYDRYFAPFIAHWGATQPENAEEQGYCYYYKDYTTQGIRLIVLDVMGWNATQLAWFGGVLSDAITNSLSVVVAIHGPAKTEDVTPMISGWMSYFGWSGSSDTLPDEGISAIDSFIEGNGKFVCWLTGHTHRDQVGYLADHHNQLCLVIGTASIDSTNAGYGDSYRKVYEESQDLFNVIAFDAKEHQVRVVRVGATTNKHFQMRHTLVVSYSEDGIAVPTIVSES